MTLKELRARRAAAATRGRELLASHAQLSAIATRDAAQDATLASVDAELTALEAEVPQLDAQIEAAERAEAREATFSLSAPHASAERGAVFGDGWRGNDIPKAIR